MRLCLNVDVWGGVTCTSLCVRVFDSHLFRKAFFQITVYTGVELELSLPRATCSSTPPGPARAEAYQGMAVKWSGAGGDWGGLALSP